MTQAEIYQPLAHTYADGFPDTRPWAAHEFQALLNTPHTVFCGTAQSYLIGRVIAGEAEIITLVTAPNLRRQGRAKALLSAFEAQIKYRHADRVFLEVASNNEVAQTLYQNAGYTRCGHRPNYYHSAEHGSIDANLYHKNLSCT